jgi:predicted branched-subunit amino acid permease
MTDLVRLYIRHVMIGFALSAVFVVLLFGLNVANLRHLVLSVEGGITALLMLVVFNGIVFSGVQFGIAVMRMAQDADGDGGRGNGIPVAVPVPATAWRKPQPRRL